MTPSTELLALAALALLVVGVRSCGSAMTLRKASAQFIEAGRALGRLEQAKAIESQLGEIIGEDPPERDALMAQIQGLARRYMLLQEHSQKQATAAQTEATRLMVQLENPGARLARRLVHSVRAARKAWRTSAR